MPDFATAAEKGAGPTPRAGLLDTPLPKDAKGLYWQQWCLENQVAIKQYNARIALEGTFTQQVQRWLETGPSP